ncbi:MAG: LLM class flavin-dependent oxidoreductase [Actinomycetota bacterium]
MQVGIQLPEAERFVPWTEYREMAVLAEDVGFDSLWLGDHLFYDKPDGLIGPHECWSLLAAVAAVTERVLLGPLVTPTGFRNPAMLAKMAATVDEIAGGRLVLGLGSGWYRREFEGFGHPFDNRVSRFAEAFTIITDLVRTGRSDREGEWHRADDARLVPPARPDMPIMVGSTGPRMLAIAAAEMNWWNEWWSRVDNDPAKHPPRIDVRDQALTEAGRDPAEVTRSVAVMVELPGGTGRTQGTTEQVEPIAGPPERIAERLLEFEGLVDHLQLVVDPITSASVEALAPVVVAVQAAA